MGSANRSARPAFRPLPPVANGAGTIHTAVAPLLPLLDVSPAFRWNAGDARLLAPLTRLWETPQAVVHFASVCDRLSDYGYWYVLGALWVGYTGWSDLSLWRRLLSSDRPHRAECLMKPSELREMERLPRILTLYRAHRVCAGANGEGEVPASRNEADWLSYTLDPQKAGFFAAQRGVSVVHRYLLPKADALALFTRRGEDEVLCLDRAAATPDGLLDVVAASPAAPGKAVAPYYSWVYRADDLRADPRNETNLDATALTPDAESFLEDFDPFWQEGEPKGWNQDAAVAHVLAGGPVTLRLDVPPARNERRAP